MNRDSVGRALCALFGFACVGVESWGTWEFLYAQHGWNYLTLGGILVTCASALLPASAQLAGRQHQPFEKWMARLAIPLALAIVFTVSIERTGTAADTGESGRLQTAENIKIANTEATEALTQLPIDKAAVKKNCDVWGPVCDKAKAAQRATEQKLADARRTLKSDGVEKGPSMARRIVALVPALTPEQVVLYQPMLLPVALAILGPILIAIGLGGTPREPKQGFWARRRARRARSDVEIAVISPDQVSVIPPTMRPRLVASNEFPRVGSVKIILSKNLQSRSGSEVELANLAERYVAVCRSENKRMTSESRFAADLKAMAVELGIETRSVGNRFWLIDVELRDALTKSA